MTTVLGHLAIAAGVALLQSEVYETVIPTWTLFEGYSLLSYIQDIQLYYIIIHIQYYVKFFGMELVQIYSTGTNTVLSFLH